MSREDPHTLAGCPLPANTSTGKATDAQTSKRRRPTQPQANDPTAEGSSSDAPTSTSESAPAAKRPRHLPPAAQPPRDEPSIRPQPQVPVPLSATPLVDSQAEASATLRDIKVLDAPRGRVQPEIYIEEENGDWIKWPYDSLSMISFDKLFSLLASRYDVEAEEVCCLRFLFVDAHKPVNVDIERGLNDAYKLLQNKIIEVIKAEGHEGVFKIHAVLRLLRTRSVGGI